MAKKNNKKAEREALKQQRAAQFREKELKAKEAEKDEQEKKENEKILLSLGEDKGNKKSLAKAAGLKSAFVVNENLLVTSFGKGNAAVIEKEVLGETIIDKHTPAAFELESGNKTYAIKGRVKGASFDDPRAAGKGEDKKSNSRQDAIKRKGELEKRYFGKEFEDNIHIQVIYNIMDIEKILAPYANNIVYEINNLARDGDKGNYDFVGYIYAGNSYEIFKNPEKYFKKFDKRISGVEESYTAFDKIMKNKALNYFGSELSYPGDKYKEQYEEKMYYIFGLLGGLRQYCFHGDTRNNNWLYTLKALQPGSLKVMDSLYSDRIQKVNSDFISLNKSVNFPLIFEIYGSISKEEKEKIISEFYDFNIRKSSKNLGFSVKKLRERLLESERGRELKDKRFDTMRSKLYMLLDFIIYKNYASDNERMESIVNKLRAAVSDNEKEVIYIRETEKLWDDVSEKVEKTLLPGLNEKNISALKAQSENPRYVGEIKNICASVKNIEVADDSNSGYFCKLINLVTMFLDGKEINDLLTTLVNKFENIGSLISVMVNSGMKLEFAKEYKMFEDTFKNNRNIISENLRLINSFARMSLSVESVPRNMLKDAILVLGTRKSEAEVDELVKAMVKKNEGKVKNPLHGIRNFLINNVVKSRRFQYLVRYADSKNVKKLLDNDDVIKFVLENIHKSLPNQIEKYAVACGASGYSPKTRINALTEIIKDVHFEKFENVKQNTNGKYVTKEQLEEKERYIAVISLYLTVLYQIAKNLVYINSRYSIAFHCLERDKNLYSLPKDGYNSLTGLFIEKGYLKKHPCEYLKQNIGNSNEFLIRRYRNNIDHLQAVRDAYKYIGDFDGKNMSYFGLYHYTIQRTLEEEFDVTRAPRSISAKYFSDIKKYRSYSKDFVKALNVPFGYNLPRYKNLSIEELFDKNIPREKLKSEM